MKHMHMMMALITIALFLWQSYQVLIAKNDLGKKSKIFAHVIYLLVIVSGVITMMPLLSLNVPLQWVAAKMILLVAAISASSKAFRPGATQNHRQAGVFIALVAYIAIITLAIIKPSNVI